jgi:hypothetical protein
MSYRHVRTTCSFAFALAACATPNPSSGSARGYDRSVLSREEIAQRSFDNMHSVVTSLRSGWLRPPLSGSGLGARSVTAAPTIYVDGRLLGALELLKTFSAESVEQARYYNATDAQNRFGTAVATPVIELVTRGRPPQGTRVRDMVRPTTAAAVRRD